MSEGDDEGRVQVAVAFRDLTRARSHPFRGCGAIGTGIVAVAVGTALWGRPPHRSGRAELPHPALTSGAWRRSDHWDKDAGPLRVEEADSPAGRTLTMS